MTDASGNELKIGDSVVVSAIVLKDLGEILVLELPDGERTYVSYTVVQKAPDPVEIDFNDTLS